MNRKIEILAPAGSYEGMQAAIHAGCDAVYIGGSRFGARAYAGNPEEEMLLRAIDEVHVSGKRLYLTVNTLLKEKEMAEELYSFIDKFYLQGLDAVIVQDVGVLHFLHRHFPKLPIHASTQMTLTMAQGAALLKAYGVTRMVTARELSLAEIRNIRENTDMEIETFVHGALCYSYSGQCLMSSMIGGRSGNRGRCAQPCRMPYQMYSNGRQISSNQEKYLLSPKDINTLSIIPDLIEAGIDSFKIEGRMKRPEYAAIVSALYRKYVDLYFVLGKEGYAKAIHKEEFTKDMTMLMDIYNRGGFCEGYAKTYHGRTMMSLCRPNHRGVYVGDVKGMKGNQAVIALKEDLNAQDILEFRKKEEKIYEFTMKDSQAKGETVRANVGKAAITRIAGSKVYRTKNNALLEEAAKVYMTKNQTLAIHGHLTAKVGEKLALTVTCGECSITAYHDVVEKALKQPMTEEKLLAPLMKTGETPFYFDAITVSVDEPVFVPVSRLNEIRRDALQKLQNALAGRYHRNREHRINKDDTEHILPMDQKRSFARKAQPGQEGDTFGICVTIQSRSQFDRALTFPEINCIYANYDTLKNAELSLMADAAEAADKEFYLVLPPVCRLSVYQKLHRDLDHFMEKDSVRGFIVKNFEEIALIQCFMKERRRQKEIILNHNMYVFNKEAMEFWQEQGINRFCAPVEQNLQELKILDITGCDILVYGYLPLMVSAQCLFDNTQHCPNQGTGYLIDRMEKKFMVQTNCNLCYNTIYNGQSLSLMRYASEVKSLNPGNIRLDFTIETEEEMKQAITAILDTYIYGREYSVDMPGYTTGHFKRGID